MKKLKVIMIAAFALAIGSAFATNQSKASDTFDYYRLDEKNPEVCLEIDPCDAGSVICTKFVPAVGAARVIWEDNECQFVKLKKP